MEIYAIYNNGNSEYFRDSEGHVYKFINGVMDINYPYLRLIGKVSKLELSRDFDAALYSKYRYAPLLGAITKTSKGLYWEC